MSLVSMKVNGEAVCHEVPARMHLGDYLRDEARLTGTHLGCEHGVCGACTVLVDGRPVRSCITFAVACESREVVTVEGYDEDPVMRRLRAAFTAHHALQCGFCTPGMLATARDIVLRLPQADEKRVRIELSGNLCRCTGYMGIVAAVRAVLRDLQEQPDPAVEALRRALPAAAPLDGLALTGAGAAPQLPPLRAFEPRADEDEAAAPQARTAAGAKEGKGKGQHIDGEFSVPFPPEQVWAFMVDLPRVAGCLPGAQITAQHGEEVQGRIGVKFGPMQAAFEGTAKLERDDAARAAILRGAGKDTVSQSRAQGDIGYRLQAEGPGTTRVVIDMDYSLQGPLAQFSRSGLVQDFVRRMIAEFGRNVVRRMQNPGAPDDAPAAAINPVALFFGVLKDRIMRLFQRRRR
ncbi:xanthine dehydrogenase family Fe-S subunit [Bordetella pseudohinzii]|uniref:Carbon monoxide dehydrogenase n=1 Tax=Bordetella pseudohinzii TaxID=1331258 RepID=A0A0J6C4W6_9BORD|nr:2Fe-2S iron-sulfur cluster-binding protein [Bordetella pseudohinzii]ANY17563.1 carbon monoxide dehydrogenase [Bordetella pseudohinzii]KMM25791.1 carbon monoxide dehydrogenase [Bordetella pseudohinzii]KXA81779.1 carbon monoxide dehydrogenase [Bordetella pseudohinzii]KXA82981.1 carbon monoxide dehydrogenase [Bordetella pseudohinzii]CUI74007.1 Carbon monoxide dehydrogenase small chain [Bordetella pseudohinzii]